jgi:hypothetical protein
VRVEDVEALETVDHVDVALLHARLLEEHGRPSRLPDDVDGAVLVFGHRDEEAARVFAAANRAVYGHPAAVDLREAVGWVSVVDLRPRLAELDRERFGLDPRRTGGGA